MRSKLFIVLCGLLLPPLLFAAGDPVSVLKGKYLSPRAVHLPNESRKIQDSLPAVGGVKGAVHLFRCGVSYNVCLNQLKVRGSEFQEWNQAAAKAEADRRKGAIFLFTPPEQGANPLTIPNFKMAAGVLDDEGAVVFLASHLYDWKRKDWVPQVNVRFIMPIHQQEAPAGR